MNSVIVNVNEINIIKKKIDENKNKLIIIENEIKKLNSKFNDVDEESDNRLCLITGFLIVIIILLSGLMFKH